MISQPSSHKAIEKEPNRRYQSAQELADDLQRFLENQPIQARRITLVGRAWRWCRRNPAVAALLLGILGVTVIGFIAVLVQWRSSFQSEEQARFAEQKAKLNAANARKAEAQAKANALEALNQSTEAKIANQKLRATLSQLERVTYNAHINLAQHAWNIGGLRRTKELLAFHQPSSGHEDLRGFEWYYLDRLCNTCSLTIIDACKKGNTLLI